MKRSGLFISLSLWAMAPAAPAAIIYSGIQNIDVPQTFAGVYVNILTKATSFSQPADFDSAPWINLDFGGVDISNGNALRPVITAPDRVVNLSPGQNVGSPSNLPPGASFSSSHTGPAPEQFQLTTLGYVGFGFSPTVGAPVQYGWAKITVNNAGPGTFHDWAYEGVANTAIRVGAIPEPAGAVFLLMALGGFGLRRSRQR